MESRLFNERSWQQLKAKLDLSGRQLELCRLICKSMSTKEMATALQLSPHTVQMHMKCLFKKLAVNDRVGLVVRLVVASRRS